MPCFIHTENKARVHRTHKKRQKRKKDSERKMERKTHMVRGLWRLSTEASGNELVCTELKLEFWNRAKRFLLSIPRKILAGHTGTQTFENETQMTSVSHAELHANGRTIQKKKWCNDAGFNRRLSSKKKKRERERKKKGVSRWVKKEGEENLLHGLQVGHFLLWTPPSRHLQIPLYLRKELLSKSVKTNGSTVNHNTETKSGSPSLTSCMISSGSTKLFSEFGNGSISDSCCSNKK